MKSLRVTALLSLLIAPMSAYAHPGHGGFLAGVAHPFFGLDHLLAMFAVGLLAARLDGNTRSLPPAGFVLAGLLGAVLGLAGLPLPGLESLIAVSVVALGLLLAQRGDRLTVPWVLALVVPWGVFHGNAHALEASGSPAMFIAGFVLGTTLLHVTGLWVGSRLHTGWLRFGGGLIASLGAWLLWATLT